MSVIRDIQTIVGFHTDRRPTEHRDLSNRTMFERGRLYMTYEPGRKLWGEEYVGPEPFRGTDPQYYEIHKMWFIKRGDGAVFAPAWFRVCMGMTWVQFRFRPFIFKVSRYNGRYDFHLRWN